MPPFPSITGRYLPIIKRWFWPILAFVGNFVAFQLLGRNPDFKELFGAKQEWLVNAFWSAAQHLMSFLLICNLLMSPQMKDKCKNSLPLNVILTYICLAVPAIISHLAEYPEFHIKIEDVEQHNSRMIHNLFASCTFAISSWGLSKTYVLSFECGCFSICLGYAMLVSLAIVDKTGNNRHIAYILATYIFCFMLILGRKYLEIEEDSNTARQRDEQSSDDTNTDAAGQSPSASGTTDFQASQTESSGGSALNQPIEVSEIALRICGDRTLEGLRGKDGSSGNYARRESRELNEHHWDNFPPRIYIDTSSSYGDTEDGEDVPHIVKEGNDNVMTDLGISEACFAEGIDDRVGKIEEGEVSGQEIGQEEQGDMRSSTSTGDIIDGEIGNVNFGSGQMERSIDQSQESCSQGHEKDDNPLLLPKSNLKVDDGHESSDDEGSDHDDFPSGTGCKLAIGRDPDHEEGNMQTLRANLSENGSVVSPDGMSTPCTGDMTMNPSVLASSVAFSFGKNIFVSGSRKLKKYFTAVSQLEMTHKSVLFPRFWSILLAMVILIISQLVSGYLVSLLEKKHSQEIESMVLLPIFSWVLLCLLSLFSCVFLLDQRATPSSNMKKKLSFWRALTNYGLRPFVTLIIAIIMVHLLVLSNNDEPERLELRKYCWWKNRI